MDNVKEEMNFALIAPTGVVVPSIIDKKTSKKYINWGEDNKLPDYLWDTYLKNSNLQAITNAVRDYVLGDGTDTNAPIKSNDLAKAILDYIIFGGFALEGIRSKKGEIVVLKYINVMNVRVDEDLTTAYISNQWGQWGAKDLKELPLYNGNDQEHFVYYYRGDITRNINPVPMYIGALKSIEILNSTRNFHLNNLENNFSVNAIINLNNGNIKTRELEEIKNQLTEGFCGTNNAGKFLLVNGGDKDHAATIERLQSDQFGDLYKALDESSKEDIFTAFRINPMLVGVNVATGFSKEEFANAFALYNRTVIRPLRTNVTECFEEMGFSLNFSEFKINWNE